LYNGNSFSLNLNGYFLSDNENDLTKWSFPNITISANDYLIIWCDTAGNTQSGLHTTYRLSSDQEEVYLTEPANNLVIDAVHYVNMPVDMGYARVPNGTGIMKYQTHTYGANNQPITANSDIIQKKLRVYPNPSNTRIYVLGAIDNVDVFDMMGKKIFSAHAVKSIDISTWKDGVYFVKSSDSIFKIIKQ
jgi:hypothetical protein